MKKKKWVRTKLCACGECRFTDRQRCPELPAGYNINDDHNNVLGAVQLWAQKEDEE